MTQPQRLPGDLMMWVLVGSELAVFGAGLVAFLAVRTGDPAGFAAARAHLHGAAAGINTMLLVTSGWWAALGVRACENRSIARARALWAGAMLLGAGFLAMKGWEYSTLAAQGFSLDSGPAFFTFYFLLTGFHAAHVLAGIVILGLLLRWPEPRSAETGVLFWHMVDMVWVMLFPVLYLLA